MNGKAVISELIEYGWNEKTLMQHLRGKGLLELDGSEIKRIQGGAPMSGVVKYLVDLLEEVRLKRDSAAERLNLPAGASNSLYCKKWQMLKKLLSSELYEVVSSYMVFVANSLEGCKKKAKLLHQLSGIVVEKDANSLEASSVSFLDSAHLSEMSRIALSRLNDTHIGPLATASLWAVVALDLDPNFVTPQVTRKQPKAVKPPPEIPGFIVDICDAWDIDHVPEHRVRKILAAAEAYGCTPGIEETKDNTYFSISFPEAEWYEGLKGSPRERNFRDFESAQHWLNLVAMTSITDYDVFRNKLRECTSRDLTTMLPFYGFLKSAAHMFEDDERKILKEQYEDREEYIVNSTAEDMFEAILAAHAERI